MKAHIQFAQRLHAALLYHVGGAPVLVGGNHLAKLRAPVAQVVDAHCAVAQIIIDALEAVADGGGREVADVEALGDVDGGIVDADGFAAALIALPPGAFALLHGLHHRFGKINPVEEKIQVAALDFN